MFTRIQMMSIRRQPRAMVQRSGWQGFDKLNESNRIKMGVKRDTFVYDKNGKPTRIKPTSTLVHERMAKRPFVRFSRFDTAVFADYGRPYYDNNAKIEGAGVNFSGSKGYLESQKRMAALQKVREAKKAKVAKGKGKKKSRAGAVINTMCPVTGKPVRAGKVSKVDGQAIGLCCSSCKKKFEKNPAKFLGYVKEFKPSAKRSKGKQKKERPTRRR
jgi:YHS domain-containing protein